MKKKKIINSLIQRLILRKKINQQGAAMVEFAIVLPLLLVFLFGIIEFSLVAYNKQILTNAAREGARAGIVARNTPMTVSAIKQIVLNYAQNNLITFGNNVLTDADITIDPDPTSGASFGDELEVTVEFNYQFLAFPNIMELLKSYNWVNTMTLEGTSVMLYE